MKCWNVRREIGPDLNTGGKRERRRKDGGTAKLSSKADLRRPTLENLPHGERTFSDTKVLFWSSGGHQAPLIGFPVEMRSKKPPTLVGPHGLKTTDMAAQVQLPAAPHLPPIPSEPEVELEGQQQQQLRAHRSRRGQNLSQRSELFTLGAN